jgi:hypothetical protein
VSETKTLEQGTQDACPRCGEPIGTFRFCLNCGASVLETPEELGPAPADPTRPSRLRRTLRQIGRWRTPLVVFPMLGALAAVAGVGASMMTAEIPDSEPAPPEVRCWDGEVVGAAESCTSPSGEAGLRWVFPTFHPERGECVDVLLTHDYPRPAMWECDFKIPGRWVTVTYTELAGVEPARKYFEKEFAGSRREKVRTADGTVYRYVWRKRTDEGFELASMYKDFPYAVGITAAKAAYRDQALRELEFRHPDRMSIAEG